MEELTGIVTRGINNIFSVKEAGAVCDDDGKTYMCRIKGKVLSDVIDEYAPLAVGDKVLFTVHQGSEGLITRRLDRTSSFMRWNAKKSANQTVVANMDKIVIVCSTDEPPFRPRFIDRAIVCAAKSNILIVLNKCDLPLLEEQIERFELFETLGYETLKISAFDEEGIDLLYSRIEGRSVAFVGQSGVGKSTIVNKLMGNQIRQTTASVSQKFNRGRHTTNHSILFHKGQTVIVDTPGVRELMIPHTDSHLIQEYFPEFRKSRGKCAYDMCLHEHEPDCDVKRRVENNEIHTDRYESYLRMLYSLKERGPLWASDRR
ncbi:MAG: ribosome small subunit-dependent GTPase A [Sphaerochaetaceae bacterium]|nr:ribosome small subunit-dependent GTPase A [Sphaerochaetaceae bacterium]